SLYLTARQVMGRPRYVYLVACLVLSLAVAARNYRRLRDPDSRRRIRWVIAGVTIAVIPFVGVQFAVNVAEWGYYSRPDCLYSPLSGDALHPSFDRGGGLEGATVRYPGARPARLAVSACTDGAPRASRASDCVGGAIDFLESQPHHRSDAHGGFRLAEPRLDRRHRRDVVLATAGSDVAGPALFSRRVPAGAGARAPHR